MAENGSLTDLSPKQLRAVQAVLGSRTIEEAANTAGVAARTLYRWKSERPFMEELQRQEGELISTAVRRLLAIADKAITAIEDVIDHPEQEAAGVKRLAAQAIIDSMLRLRDLRNIETRLESLESVYERL